MRELSVWILALPDGKLVFQRRAKNIKHAPGLLGFFGGHLEAGETAEQAATRELKEETSLDVVHLKRRYLGDISQKTANDDALFHVYETRIESVDFEDYEGEGPEAYTLDELLLRSDVSDVTTRALTELWKE